MAKKKECKHEWRIVESFYKEISNYERSYPCYCVRCMEAAEAVLTVNKLNK